MQVRRGASIIRSSRTVARFSALVAVVAPVSLLVAGTAGRSLAQLVPASSCLAQPRPLSALSPRARLAQLTRDAPGRPLTRDALPCARDSSVARGLSLRTPLTTIHLAAHAPRVDVTSLGGLPDARGAGVLWSGRGTSWLASGGVSIDIGPLHGVAMPVVWASENRPFDFLIARDTTRSPFAAPWYDGAWSIDWPSRFGMRSLRYSGLGDSGWWFTTRYVEAGASAGTQAWGPGNRAHLLLGGDAPGIPRVFIRTSRPIATPIGAVSGTAFRGTLRESPFFDRNVSNNRRQMRAWSVEVAPNAVVQLGVAHAEISLATNDASVTSMTTVSFRLQSAEDRGSAWVELGRMGAIPSPGRLLKVPTEGLAYVVGMEQAATLGTGTTLLLSAEAVNLEQPRAVFGTTPLDYYTSGRVPQGWTHRGRVLGVATGPGSQSQWLALDLVRPRWSAGVFGERVRWNEDAFLREYLAYANRHDVSLHLGVRAGARLLGYELDVQAGSGRRLNYLFQNDTYISEYRTVDVETPQLRVSLKPSPR